MSIFTSSRTRHASIWRALRSAGLPIISTWIDEAGVGETADFGDLWIRCVNEAKSASALILYREDNEPLKGALIEAGSALGAGVPVFTVGCDDPSEYSFLNHPLVTRCVSLEECCEKVRALLPLTGGVRSPQIGDVLISLCSGWRYKVVGLSDYFNTPYKIQWIDGPSPGLRESCTDASVQHDRYVSRADNGSITIVGQSRGCNGN